MSRCVRRKIESHGSFLDCDFTCEIDGSCIGLILKVFVQAWALLTNLGYPNGVVGFHVRCNDPI